MDDGVLVISHDPLGQGRAGAMSCGCLARRAQLAKSVEAAREVVERLSAEVWQLAEVSFHEEGSSKVLSDQRHPIALPDWLVTDGSAEAMGALAQTR